MLNNQKSGQFVIVFLNLIWTILVIIHFILKIFQNYSQKQNYKHDIIIVKRTLVFTSNLKNWKFYKFILKYKIKQLNYSHIKKKNIPEYNYQ